MFRTDQVGARLVTRLVFSNLSTVNHAYTRHSAGLVTQIRAKSRLVEVGNGWYLPTLPTGYGWLGWCVSIETPTYQPTTNLTRKQRQGCLVHKEGCATFCVYESGGCHE